MAAVSSDTKVRPPTEKSNFGFQALVRYPKREAALIRYLATEGSSPAGGQRLKERIEGEATWAFLGS